MATQAEDTMIDKDPLSYEWLTYLWVLVVSLWGGVSNYVKRMTGNETVAFSLAELVGDITISGFVGLITFFLCESAQIDRMLSAAIIGISAHMGSRSLFMLERIVVNFVKSRGGKNE